MKTIECKYCHKKFETDGSRKQAGIITAHMRTCLENPNREKNIEAQKRGSAIMNQIICERQHQQKLKNDATRQEYIFHCIYCKQPYVLNLTERDYNRFIEGKGKYRKCCQKCWHSSGGKVAANIRRKKS